MDITKILHDLERAQLMAETAGKLADQRMRRIQFELIPKIEELESKVKSLEQQIHDFLNMTNEEVEICFPRGDWSKKMIGK